MQGIKTTTNVDYETLLAQAEKYDQLGLYHKADQIVNYLMKFYSMLPLEIRNRIKDQTPKNGFQSMSEDETGKGYMYLKGGDYAYMSGKGQAAYRDNIPMTQFLM